MNCQDNNRQLKPKGIEKILEEYDFWSIKGLNLEYVKPKCFNCQLVIEYKICVKGHKYNSYKVSKKHSSSITCFKN